MSFNVITKKGTALEWHLNGSFSTERIRAIVRAEKDNAVILVFSASGHELEMLSKRFINLTYTLGHCTWLGETAQFIFNNL